MDQPKFATIEDLEAIDEQQAVFRDGVLAAATFLEDKALTLSAGSVAASVLRSNAAALKERADKIAKKHFLGDLYDPEIDGDLDA